MIQIQLPTPSVPYLKTASHERELAAFEPLRATYCGIRAILVIFWTFIATSPVSGQPPVRSDERPVLSLEFSIELSEFPSHAVWSADSKVLAVVPYGPFLAAPPPPLTIHLIQVDTREQRKWATPSQYTAFSIAISADRGFLALHQPTLEFKGLSLYSLSDRKPIARAQTPISDCIMNTQLFNALAFSIDGSALWIGCRSSGLLRGSYAAAIKLALPDLQVLDMVRFDPISSDSAMQREGSALTYFQGHLLWTQVVSIYAPKLSQQYVRSIDLSTKRELFPPLKIKTRKARGVPTRLQHAMISPEHNLAVVFRSLVQRQPAPPSGTLDFAFETYDTRTGQLLVEFWSGDEQRDSGRGGRADDAALMPGSSYLVGAIDGSLNPQNHGGLIVWDARTGAIAQRIPGRSAQRISASPDGKRLALFSGRSILVYRRSQ